MSTELEIERKFLVEMPDLALLDVRRSAHIRQTYLTNGEGGSQRRVRMVTENGAVRYIYTEKVFYTDGTDEMLKQVIAIIEKTNRNYVISQYSSEKDFIIG